jgi:hypothetical protein
MRNRRGEVVTTAVTNLDIHDISRSARSFGCDGFFIVTPIEDQRELVETILAYWRADARKEAHPDRVEALSIAHAVADFEQVTAAIKAKHGEEPEVVLTDARPLPNAVSYADYRRELADPGRTRPTLIVFGTGWGVSDAFYPAVHRILTPVYGPKGKGEYNHLSVRAAAAIILDRLFGQ